MNVAQASLDLALAVSPCWTGVGSSNSNTVTDPLLPRSKDSFAGGTLWALGTPITVYTVKSHEGVQIVLDSTPSSSISSYVVSTIPFAELLNAINTTLMTQWEMQTEDIIIDTVNLPNVYTLTSASDVRHVEVILTDTDPVPNNYWREVNGTLRFYNAAPTEAGLIKVYYPARPSIKVAGTDLLPDNLRYEPFINNCTAAFYRSMIQRVKQDGKVHYDLTSDLKDRMAKMYGHGLSTAYSLMDYDPRFSA